MGLKTGVTRFTPKAARLLAAHLVSNPSFVELGQLIAHIADGIANGKYVMDSVEIWVEDPSDLQAEEADEASDPFKDTPKGDQGFYHDHD